MTITTHQATEQLLRQVAEDTYDEANGVFLDLCKDHVDFLVYNKATDEIINWLPLYGSSYTENRYFYELLSREINDGKLTVRLIRSKLRRDGRRSYEWAFYRNGYRETVVAGTYVVKD